MVALTRTESEPHSIPATRRDTRRLRRTVAAILLPIGPLAVALLRFVLPSLSTQTPAETITATSAALGRANLVDWLSLVLVLTLVPGVLAAGRLVARRTPVLSVLAVGMLVPAFVALLFSAGDPMVRALSSGVVPPGAGATVLHAFLNEPVIVIATVVFVVGHILGIVLLGVAFLRARVMPAVVAIGVIASQPLHLLFAVITPNRYGDGAAWLLATAGFAFAALRVLRTSDDDWDLAPAVRG